MVSGGGGAGDILAAMTRHKKPGKMPGHAYSERIRARVWITGENGGYLGVGKVMLLERIEEYGSISRAAKSLQMSYKRAWQLVEEMNGLGAEALVDKEAGGRGGGGARVTEKGQSAVRQYRELEKRLARFLEKESEAIEL